MSTWNSLLTSALLGTERRAPELGDDAPDLLAALSRDDTAHTLLLAAAITAAQRRAGYAPVSINAELHDSLNALLSTVAPPDITPRCSRRALRYLDRLLQENLRTRYYRVLVEWLADQARKGRRVPHPYLPDLLDRARKGSDLVPLVALVAGERGRWLAGQNADWHHIAAVDLETARASLSHTEPVDEAALVGALQNVANPNERAAMQKLLDGRILTTLPLVNTVFDRLLQPGPHLTYLSVQVLFMIAPAIARDWIEPALQRLQREQAGGMQGLDEVIHLLDFRREMGRVLDHEG